MKIVAQRVREARVESAGDVLGAIGAGLMILVGVAPGDGDEEMRWLIEKLLSLRLFEDESGCTEHGVRAANLEILCISQFTLFADVRKGTRPSYSKAAPPQEGARVYARFEELLRQALPGKVAFGRFGADMQVHLVNDGPVTLVIERGQ